MRLHPREEVVTRARVDLMEKLLDWRRDHDLTTAELFSILGQHLGKRRTGWIFREVHRLRRAQKIPTSFIIFALVGVRKRLSTGHM